MYFLFISQLSIQTQSASQVLVTHHVELVLPGAYYLVRMLDGRIDTQGTVKELRARGVLQGIEHDAAVDAHKDEQIAAESEAIEEAEAEDGKKPQDETKKPRKLVKDEHRETGGVKWSIYNRYLKASYVLRSFFCYVH